MLGETTPETRKTVRGQARKKGEQREEFPLLNVDGPSIQRSGSQSSLLSVLSTGSYGSAVSAFSNSTEYAVNVCKRHWEEVVELRCKRARKIALINEKPAPKNIRKDKPLKVKTTVSFVLIKVSQGKTYADVLGKLRKEVNPDASGSRVVSAKATQKGDVLILLDKESNKEGFTA